MSFNIAKFSGESSEQGLVVEWLDSMQKALEIAAKQNDGSSKLFDDLLSNLPIENDLFSNMLIENAQFLQPTSDKQSLEEDTPLSEAYNLSTELQITLMNPQNPSELGQKLIKLGKKLVKIGKDLNEQKLDSRITSSVSSLKFN